MTTCNLKSLAEEAAAEFVAAESAIAFLEADVLMRPMSALERADFRLEFNAERRRLAAERDARERDAIARDRAEEDAASLRHG